MTDPFNPLSWGHIFKWLVGLVLGLFGWIAVRQVRRLDDHDSRLEALDREKVSYAHFEKAVARIEQAIEKGDGVIAKALAETNNRLGAAHNRLDDIYKAMPKRGHD